MKQKNLQVTILLLAALGVAGCSNENDPIPNLPADAVELGITSAGVALTKSVITGGSNNVAYGTNADFLKSLRVYAYSATANTSYGDGNNVAGYTIVSGNTWTNSDNQNKIYLTDEVATIYAYHPLFTPATGGVMATATTDTLDFTGTGASAVIPVTLFAGNTSLDANNTIPDADNHTDGKILSAPGEVDYMWANQGTAVQASNGKASGASTTKSVTLTMKHAFSLLSFRIYNDGTYKKPGVLTKIKLEGVSGLASGATMNITSGALSTNYKNSTATLTRFIKDASGVTIGTNSNDAHKYSMLVLPDASSESKSGVTVTFTIDDVDYDVTMNDNAQWEAGENNTYTATLSGTGLEITSVKVEAWGTGTGGSLDVH